MIRTPFNQVAQFHGTFARTPDPTAFVQRLDDERIELRRKLVQEELDELIEAMKLGDRAKTLKEISDLMYVVIGTYLSLGINDTLAQLAFDEVHASNMSKLEPDGTVKRREDGKVLKGSLYRDADMHRVMALYYGQS